MNPYQPSVPTGRVPLRQDYLNLQSNFAQINAQYNSDHVPLTSTTGTPPNGFHTVVHLVPFSTDATNPPNNYPPVAPDTGPQFVAGYGQLFSSIVNDGNDTDNALFWLTGRSPNPRVLQLTSNFTPGTNTTGSSFRRGDTFLPGGFILNWGYENNSSTGIVTVSLRKSFPNNFFTAVACYRLIPSGFTTNATIFVSEEPSSGPVSSIDFYANRASPFFWFAIGN